eukprot:gene4662-3359_t
MREMERGIEALARQLGILRETDDSKYNMEKMRLPTTRHDSCEASRRPLKGSRAARDVNIIVDERLIHKSAFSAWTIRRRVEQDTSHSSNPPGGFAPPVVTRSAAAWDICAFSSSFSFHSHETLVFLFSFGFLFCCPSQGVAIICVMSARAGAPHPSVPPDGAPQTGQPCHTVEFVVLEHGLGGTHEDLRGLEACIRHTFDQKQRCRQGALQQRTGRDGRCERPSPQQTASAPCEGCRCPHGAVPTMSLVTLNHDGNDGWLGRTGSIAQSAVRLTRFVEERIAQAIAAEQGRLEAAAPDCVPAEAHPAMSPSGTRTHVPEHRGNGVTQVWRLVLHLVGHGAGGLILRAALPRMMASLEARYTSRLHTVVKCSPRGHLNTTGMEHPNYHYHHRGFVYAYEWCWGTIVTICCPHLGARLRHPLLNNDYLANQHCVDGGLMTCSRKVGERAGDGRINCCDGCVQQVSIISREIALAKGYDYLEVELLKPQYLSSLRRFKQKVFIGALDDRVVWNYSSCFVLPLTERYYAEQWSPGMMDQVVRRPLFDVAWKQKVSLCAEAVRWMRRSVEQGDNAERGAAALPSGSEDTESRNQSSDLSSAALWSPLSTGGMEGEAAEGTTAVDALPGFTTPLCPSRFRCLSGQKRVRASTRADIRQRTATALAYVATAPWVTFEEEVIAVRQAALAALKRQLGLRPCRTLDEALNPTTSGLVNLSSGATHRRPRHPNSPAEQRLPDTDRCSYSSRPATIDSGSETATQRWLSHWGSDAGMLDRERAMAQTLLSGVVTQDSRSSITILLADLTGATEAYLDEALLLALYHRRAFSLQHAVLSLTAAQESAHRSVLDVGQTMFPHMNSRSPQQELEPAPPTTLVCSIVASLVVAHLPESGK